MLKQPNTSSRKALVMLCAIIGLGALLGGQTLAHAQGQGTYQEERRRAFQLLFDGKFAEGLKRFETLAAANPSDGNALFGLGFATLSVSKTVEDAEARRQMRLKARGYMLRAKELGVDEDLKDLLEVGLSNVPPDGSDLTVSRKPEADKALAEGEAAFTKGDYDQAIAAYERALKLDPTLYEAALYIGDMYFQKKEWDKAGAGYARAIAIDPDRETAYRYWSDAYLRQGKMAEARDKAIEAIIASPYERIVWNGLVQWANVNRVQLAHPRIEIPTTVSSSEGRTNITLDAKLLDGKKDDGSSAWMFYGITRAAWRNEKFAKTFPGEKTYRHSLAEEADALRGVLESVSVQMKEKKVKQLDPSLANLMKLNDAGLLEAYILLGMPDEGIAQDYVKYRAANRDKLRRYFLEYVVTGGGK